jgi:outer membrane immunogenic protein
VLLQTSPNNAPAVLLRLRNQWTGALSLRAGLAFDRTLLYGKVGVSETEFQYQAVGVGAFTGAYSGDTTRTRLLVGAGAEVMLSQHWTAKLEYNHIDFGRRTVNLAGQISGPVTVTNPNNLSFGEKAQIDLVKFGLNYKL